MYKQNLSLRDKLAKNYINAIGWHTSHKYVLIESDDWGAIRMPSKDIYDKLTKFASGGDFFDENDSLESNEDLELLFDVLASVKDSNGANAIMSPVSVVANPNFEAIENNGRSKYVWEPVTDTFKRHPHTSSALSVIMEGISSGIWFPQFHGREHFNVKRWMPLIGDSSNAVADELFTSQAFDTRCFPKDRNYMASFDCDTVSDVLGLNNIMIEGLSLFEKIYGYKATSFCAPCGVVHEETLNTAIQHGIKMFAGQWFKPNYDGTATVVNDVWGKRRNNAIAYRRNCKFEPSRTHGIDWVDRCLYEISIAFRWGKPANIDSHRVNFIGSVCPENRDYTLREFSRLLKEIVKRWPDVEFINSVQLYNAICQQSTK